MPSKRSPILLFIAALIALSMACSLTGSETIPEIPPGDSSQDTIATAVAATLAAGQAENLPPTIHPTVTSDTTPLPQPNYTVNGVSLFISPQLAENITAVMAPANVNEEALFWSTPEHREYQFNNWALKMEAFQQPALRIFSVSEFTAVNPNVGERLAALQVALTAQPSDGSGLDVPSIFGAGQLFQSNIKFLDFQNGSGARWLSQYGQAYFPIGLPSLFYTFQGFTTDGAFYISAILPVNHPVLPDTNSVTLDDAFYNNYDSYAAETRITLDAQADSSFNPSLELLDQLVETLLVEAQ
jgi:hypothetical protein